MVYKYITEVHVTDLELEYNKWINQNLKTSSSFPNKMALSNQNQYFMILNLARQKQTEKTEEITYCCTLHHLKNHKSKHQLSF